MSETCRHCGKPIEPVNWALGPGWRHRGGGSRCEHLGAQPEVTSNDRMNAKIGAYGPDTSDLPDGTDIFERTQEPRLTPTADPLARFVIARIIELELEPRGEVMAVYDEPAGPMAHRYAKHVRADCVVFRRIVAEYLAEVERVRANREEAGASARAYGLRYAVRAAAERWSDHPEFLGGWRLT